jgi:hypothetical protein
MPNENAVSSSLPRACSTESPLASSVCRPTWRVSKAECVVAPRPTGTIFRPRSRMSSRWFVNRGC